MKVMVYCQHVLGIGHLCRIMLILEQMAEHRITLVLGGPPISVTMPDHVQVVRIPGLRMNEEFAGLLAVDGRANVDAIKIQRINRLHDLFHDLQPDLLLLELFPFGRNAFSFELLPLLEQAQKQGKCRVVSSVRDILVERDNTVKFEQRVIERLNRYFHLLLVHGDPKLVRLDETFSRMADINIPVSYTGYICQPPKQGDRERLRKKLFLTGDEQLIVVSAGSGSVGTTLLQAAIRAFALLASNIRMQVFTGPYMAKHDFSQLAVNAGDRLVIDRFSNDFPGWLAAADLSISMAGYNTTMNLISSGCRSLVYPFAQNHEQRMRAERLEELGHLRILTAMDLAPVRLAEEITRRLNTEARPVSVLLDGALETAVQVSRLCG